MAILRCFSLTTRIGLGELGVLILLGVTTLAIAYGRQGAGAALPEAPGGKVVTLNRRPGNFTEPSIAVNPQEAKQVLTGFQTPATVAYSEDSGESWQIATGTAPENYKVSGDVSVTYDILGHAFLCYIAFDKLGSENYWAHNATRNGVFVRRSLDGGKTWEANAAAVDEQATRPGMPFEDKPYLVSDNNPNSPYAGSLYLGWTEFSLTKSIILFSRSNNGGIAWSAPFEISSHEGLPRDDNGALEGFAAAAAPNGLVYALWADGDSIAFTDSRDGGITFMPSRKIIDTPASYFTVGGVERSNGFPQIAVDPRTGRIFVTWSDYRNGDVDVFCATSADRGRSWSQPVRVNTDALHDGSDQFFQWLAVDPSDGSANILFYDRRDDPENRHAAAVLARSTNGGQSFSNYAWAETTFDPGEAFIGDYTGITALNGRVYGAWTETIGRARSAPAVKLSTVIKIGEADFQNHSAP
jgi:hypothetical protein